MTLRQAGRYASWIGAGALAYLIYKRRFAGSSSLGDRLPLTTVMAAQVRGIARDVAREEVGMAMSRLQGERQSQLMLALASLPASPAPAPAPAPVPVPAPVPRGMRSPVRRTGGSVSGVPGRRRFGT